MSTLPFLVQTGSSAASGSSGDNSFIGPEQGIDGQSPGAPGGRFPQDDLPMNPTPSGGGWSEGFSPSSENPPLPAPGSNDGAGLPPNGNRR